MKNKHRKNKLLGGGEVEIPLTVRIAYWKDADENTAKILGELLRRELATGDYAKRIKDIVKEAQDEIVSRKDAVDLALRNL